MKVAKADLFIYNGAELEPFAEKWKTLQKENIKIVNASKESNCVPQPKMNIMIMEMDINIKKMNIITIKTHTWLNPILAMKQAEKSKMLL